MPGNACTEDSQCCDTGGDYYCNAGVCVQCTSTTCETSSCQVGIYCSNAGCSWTTDDGGHCCDADYSWTNGACCEDGWFWDEGINECRPFKPCTPDCNPWNVDCVQSGIACCDLDGTGEFTYQDPITVEDIY